MIGVVLPYLQSRVQLFSEDYVGKPSGGAVGNRAKAKKYEATCHMLFCVNDNKMVEILTINIIVSTKGEYVFNDSKNKVSKKLILCKNLKLGTCFRQRQSDILTMNNISVNI